MSIEIKDFDENRVDEAGRLLLISQKKYLKSVGRDIYLDESQTVDIVAKELAQETAKAFMVYDGEQITGYMITIIRDDPHRGKSGWVNLGGWAVAGGYESSLPQLYRETAAYLVSKQIMTHYVMVYEHDDAGRDLFLDLSFGKEQTHAILVLDDFDPDIIPESHGALELRSAVQSDKSQIESFSRIIAEHQTKSPCFASAPLAYLEELDKGFSELLDDEEAEVYLALAGGEAFGLEIYYEMDRDLLVPELALELCVGAVKDEHRGQKIGLKLTAYTLKIQKDKGVKYIITDWRCANLLSGKFWFSIGFRSLAHRLVRRIDPMV